MRFFLTALLISFFIHAHAQSDAQSEFENGFGVFSQEEINYKQCPFDKNADAVVFFDKGITNYDDERKMLTYKRVRMKILKEKGVAKGDLKIYYYSDNHFESIRNIDAMVLSTDDHNNQVITRLNKNNIFDRKLNAYYSEITIALPNIKPGSIIDYRYLSEKNNYGGLKNWIFQSDIPVLLSSYNLTIVPNHEFAYSVKKSPSLPIDIKTDASEGRVSFTMKDIPGLRDEAYMGSEKDYL
ncbi:MAG TPA: DUF3857 domain-containing protein, partial [Flavisolibacter sp.]|nr:DUF3857 domain-containing protein [Flavisolibacter sp.]